MTKPGKNRLPGSSKKAKAYRWRDDQDPIVPHIARLITDSGESYEEISRRSGKSAGTVSRLANADTIHPFNDTITEVFNALGIRRGRQNEEGRFVKDPLRAKLAALRSGVESSYRIYGRGPGRPRKRK